MQCRHIERQRRGVHVHQHRQTVPVLADFTRMFHRFLPPPSIRGAAAHILIVRTGRNNPQCKSKILRPLALTQPEDGANGLLKPGALLGEMLLGNDIQPEMEKLITALK